MRLHIKVCPVCKRFSIRIDGETDWCRNMRYGFLEELRDKRHGHEIVSELPILCHLSDCEQVAQRHLAQTAGATH